MIDHWCPPADWQTVRVAFISDLHLLADRSLGPAADPIIADALRNTDLCVWGGDLFDFRWTRRSIDDSIRWALRWLQRWADDFPDVRFQYLYGNHDVHAPFRGALDQFTSQCRTYETPREIIQIGDTVMLHGDAVVGHRDAARFADYRMNWANRRPAAAWKDRWYAAAVTMRIHRAAAVAGHRHRSTCRQLHRYLQRVDADAFNQTRRVVFGHTHRRLGGFPHLGRRYHNPGAAIRHVPFEPVRLTVELSNLPAEAASSQWLG